MAIQQVGQFAWPEVWAPAYVNRDMNGTTLRVAYLFRVPKDGTIDRIAFHTGTTTVTSQSIDIRLETSDESSYPAKPSGTLYGGSAAGVLASVAAATNYEVTLATPATAAAGDFVWVVFQWTSTTGVVAIGAESPLYWTATQGLYTASWAVGTSTRGMIGVRYDDGLYVPTDMAGPGVSANIGFSSSSTPDERGILMSLPFGIEASGLWSYVDFDDDVDVVLYDDADNVLASVSRTDIQRPSTGAGYYQFPFDAPVELVSGDYRIILKPTTTSNITTRTVSLVNAAARGAFSGGTLVQGTSRTNAGAWTDTDTTIYAMGFLVSGIDIPAGGGMIGGGNLRGGFQ